MGTELSWTHFLSGRNIQLCDHITENGEEVKHEISREVTKESVTQVIRVGTMEEETKK